MWTASRNCLYMSVTVHWLDDNFLGLQQMPDSRLAPGSYSADFI